MPSKDSKGVNLYMPQGMQCICIDYEAGFPKYDSLSIHHLGGMVRILACKLV